MAAPSRIKGRVSLQFLLRSEDIQILCRSCNLLLPFQTPVISEVFPDMLFPPLSPDVILIRVSQKRGSGKFQFIYLILLKRCIFKAFRLPCVPTLCIFPCFCPYEPKQGKVFYSPPTTLSSSLAEVRFASLVA